ncbi:NADH:flavin oxidoreductase [Saccharospirillum mangrovi]|uniref:NADH:flavin oxidoreductase n=1 Tax=Saccharospirillum mangrovi TaxID=2161747 RepID=UPI000D33B3B6|nr:NADH:flavin oxidoreductase [Saccharospirillum mangrovi]
MTTSALDTSVLFQPYDLGSVTLKNRLVMAPMTRAMAPQGIPGQANADYYRRRAEGDVGLILSEGTVINRPVSRNEPGIPFFHGEAALAGWKSVIDAVHQAGGRMGPQIWHTGTAPSASGWKADGEMESPSGLFAPEKPAGKVMTDADIADTIAAFTQAAVDAKRLGFDVVEVHGAHGYLIDQFFWSGSNQRNDQWGGDSLLKRANFGIEVVKSIRQAIGPDFPLILRLSQWKQQDYSARLANTPAEMESWLTALSDAGVDVFHCSQRRFWEAEFPEVDGDNGLNFAGWAKKLTGKTTISVGSVGLDGEFFGAFAGKGSQQTDIGRLIQRMERNEFDLIAVGRALLSDAQWVQKIQRGANDELLGFNPADLAKLA